MNAKAQMIKDTICSLAMSQGSYGRLIENMGGVNGARFNQGCEELAKVEEITDLVSLVMYLEG